MALLKIDEIFALTTVAADPTSAIARSGGWSEGFWTQQPDVTTNGVLNQQLTYRARLLPAQAAIIGYRATNYTISGNKLLPGASSTLAVFKPGNQNYPCDVPQMALEFGAQGATGLNTSRPEIRGLPDQFVVTGEYTPSAIFKGQVTSFANIMTAGNFGFIGRDKSQPSARVIFYAANVVTTDVALAGLAVGNWIRFNRVYDVNSKPVTGTYRVAAIDATGKTITLNNGPATTIVQPSGTVRIDVIIFTLYNTYLPVRVQVRKVGRPSDGYRGRRSKRRS